MKVIKPNEFSNVDGSFTRASTATFISGGLLQTAALDIPRFEDGILLLEPSATNLYLHSASFDNVSWTKTNSSISVDATVAPDTTVTADRITESASAGQHWVGQVGVTGVLAAVSIFAKADTRSRIGILQTTNSAGAIFDLTLGQVVSTTAGYTASIKELGNGWYLCTCSGDFNSGAYFPIYNAAGSLSYTGDGSSGLFIWGAQFENTAVSSSYIPTTSTTSTRSADVVNSLSRASSATVTNAGVMTLVGSNVARYQAGNLLVEQEATNWLFNSQNFGAWTLSNVNASTPGGPSYLLYAPWWNLTKTTSTPNASIQSNSEGVAANEVTTLTLALRQGNVSQCAVGIYNGSDTWGNSIDSTASILEGPGVITQSSGGLFTVTGLSTTLPTLIRITRTHRNASFSWVQIFPDSPASTTNGAFIQATRAQYETGSTPTSYIPTTATAVTRAPDIVFNGLVYTNVTEAYFNWNDVTTYALGNRVLYQNNIYESLINSNLNVIPSSSPSSWLNLGADNRHSALDGKVGTKTQRTSGFRMMVTSDQISSLALLNLEASLGYITIYDLGSLTKLYEYSFGASGEGVLDWFQYFFFDPIEERNQLVLTGINALYPNTLVAIELVSPVTEVSSLGSLLIGETESLGQTQYAPKAGIVDYSKKDVDQFGNVSIVERPFSKRLSVDIHFRNSELNRVQRFLYSIRATPVVWIATEDPTYEEALVVYGFYKDFSTTIAYPSHSLCSLEIEGLT